jgi:hypothetical protein
MGFRDFIKKKVLKRGDGDGDYDDEDDLIPGTQRVAAKTEDVTVVDEEAETEEESGERDEVLDIPKKYDLQHESVQDKINRVKSGRMTDEEKQAFLRNTLTKGKAGPLRQPLPTEETVRKGGKSTASPFPKDSIGHIFGRGKKEDKSWALNEVARLQTEDQKKKREYLAKVTDPNRFHSYTVTTRGGGTPSRPSVTPIQSTPDATSYATIGKPPPTTPPAPITPPAPEDLGARLGAAALENSLRQKELQKERERIWEEARLEEERRRADLQRQREDEQARLEAEAAARQRERDEAKRRAEEEGRRREQEERRREAARLKELQAAQDEYWRKKLEAERAKREGREPVEVEELVTEEIKATDEDSSGEKVSEK